MAEIPAGLDPVPHAENTALVARSLMERAKGIESTISFGICACRACHTA